MDTQYYMDGENRIYTGDMQPGDRKATEEDIRARFGDPLENARTAKLAEISAAFAAAEATGHLLSSLGFTIDANERANRDTDGLITILEATGGASTYFCDHNNVMREVSLEDVKTIRLEIIRHGQELYAKKWALRSAAEHAASIEELEAITWSDPAATGEGSDNETR